MESGHSSIAMANLQEILRMEEKTDMVNLHILQAKFSKETLKKISLRGQEKFTLMKSSFNKASG